MRFELLRQQPAGCLYQYYCDTWRNRLPKTGNDL